MQKNATFPKKIAFSLNRVFVMALLMRDDADILKHMYIFSKVTCMMYLLMYEIFVICILRNICQKFVTKINFSCLFF